MNFDRRDVASNCYLPYEVDEANNRIYLFPETEDEIELPLEWEVCHTCRGKGSHVNPSIDAHGITSQEMYELGPEFERDYFSGVYDVPCSECKGRRVTPYSSDPRFEKAVSEAWQEAYSDMSTRYYESGGNW